MFSKISLQGFKSFRNAEFTLEPLTLLTGLNSSGKSSLIQSIRVLWDQTSIAGHGPFSELVSVHSTGFEIKGFIDSLALSLSYNDGVVTGSNEVDRKKNFLSYIGAGRLGPRPFLPLWTKTGEPGLGEQGEYVLDFLGRHEELTELPPQLIHPVSKSTSVRLNTAAWLNIISPGVNFDYKVNRKSKTDSGSAEFSGRRPTNVGFGLSYTLPIIVNVLVYSALIAKGLIDGATILLENPEAHLHPSGQTELGRFLAKASQCGIQLIIETHSDHILNGIRLAVKEKILDADDTAFFYFTYNFEEEYSTVEQPVIDQYGMFDEWPSGFFDETEKSLGKLI